MNNIDNIKQIIVQTIIDDGNRKIPPAIIYKKINEKYRYLNKHSIYQTIDYMIDNGFLKKTFDNKVVLGYIDAPVDTSVIYEGVVSINSQKDGFIKLFDDEGNIIEEFFIHRTHLNGALRGDTVRFALLKKDQFQSLREGSVIEIVKRNKDVLVAEVIKEDDNVLIVPDDNKIYLDIIVDNIDIAKNNDKVLLQINRYEPNKIFATITRIIGNKNAIGADIESVVYDNGAEIGFDVDVIEESEKLKFQITDEQMKYRKDLRHLKTITIDPATSKDLDDAICVTKLENNNYKLYVSIADVSYYVQPNTKLDESAYNRGTSIYLADRVIPMLPHNISDNLCSLNPNEEKFTLTSEIEINPNGEIVNYDVYPSIIYNYRRFSYDEVNDFFEDKNLLNDLDEEIKQELEIGLELHKILRKYKNSKGYIELNIKEPKIVLNEQGIPVYIEVKKSGTAQKMIEDFMVLANESVTLFANKHDLDFIYRIHDRPDSKKIDNFQIEAQKIGFNAKLEYTNVTSLDLLNLLNKNKDHSEFNLFNRLILKTMQKAKYSTTNIGHFGLAIDNYTHFTSPIRRYSDLIVHRLFWMNIFSKELYTDGQRNELKNSLIEIIDQCNKTEIRQLLCEREVNSMKFAEYMTYHINEIYEGVVSNVTSFGFFVELDNLVEGLVTLKSLDDDFYSYDSNNFTLVGQKSRRIFTIGKRVKIIVVSANKQERKIDFKIVF